CTTEGDYRSSYPAYW
nr:immunoglobulin heavy chain junction region [Macaca mulatta]